MTDHDRLVLGTAAGVWRVASGSGVQYFVDLRDPTRPLFLRDPGPHGTPASYDGVWVQLASVTSRGGDRGTVIKGARHHWQTWPEGPGDFYRVYHQAEITTLEPVPDDEVPTGRERRPREAWEWNPHVWGQGQREIE